jgi:two-component system invasion response regulator UvrY
MRSIVIVEDHKIVRQGLKLLFSTEQNYEVIADFDSGEGLINYLKTHGTRDSDTVFTLILDITLPGRNGLEVLRFMNAFYPQIPVLVLSMHSELSMAMRALRAGAAGYLQKDADPETLKAALHAVSSGGKYVSPAVTSQLVDGMNDNRKELPHEKLSEREFEILLLYGGGLSNKEIAEHLSLSAKTVSTYRNRVLKKLDLKSTPDMVKYMMSNSLQNLKE